MMRTTIDINPGGAIAPSQVMGRDPFIARLWEILAVQSVALLAPRRLGKTSVCRRMVDQQRTGFVTRLRDLEGCQDAGEFVRLLYKDVSELLPEGTRASQSIAGAARRLFGAVEIPWAKVTLKDQDWRDLLEAIFEDLNRHGQETNTRIVLFWDEFTWFLSDLERKGQAREAMALLDRLRAARQRFPNVAMVLTGSIGLHEVLGALRRHGYGNDPINDVSLQVLHVLAQPEAQKLAAALIIRADLQERLDPSARNTLASDVARVCEGHPYLIQHVAQKMKFNQDLSATGAQAALASLLDDAADPLQLRHYMERLAGYFADGDLETVRQVLDRVARAEQGPSVDEIHASLPELKRDRLIELLSTLRQDLYLDRTGGRFTFSLIFLRDYWRAERGL